MIRSYRRAPKDYKWRQIITMCMPLIDYVVDVFYRRKHNVHYRVLFRIMPYVKRYDPMTYDETLLYWDNLIKQYSEDEIRSILYIFLEPSIQSFIELRNKHKRADVDHFIVGGLLYRLRNYFRDLDSKNKTISYMKDYDGLDEEYYNTWDNYLSIDLDWVFSYVPHEWIDSFYLSPMEKYIVYLIATEEKTQRDVKEQISLFYSFRARELSERAIKKIKKMYKENK